MPKELTTEMVRVCLLIDLEASVYAKAISLVLKTTNQSVIQKVNY